MVGCFAQRVSAQLNPAARSCPAVTGGKDQLLRRQGAGAIGRSSGYLISLALEQRRVADVLAPHFEVAPIDQFASNCGIGLSPIAGLAYVEGLKRRNDAPSSETSLRQSATTCERGSGVRPAAPSSRRRTLLGVVLGNAPLVLAPEREIADTTSWTSRNTASAADLRLAHLVSSSSRSTASLSARQIGEKPASSTRGVMSRP